MVPIGRRVLHSLSLVVLLASPARAGWTAGEILFDLEQPSTWSVWPGSHAWDAVGEQELTAHAGSSSTGEAPPPLTSAHIDLRYYRDYLFDGVGDPLDITFSASVYLRVDAHAPAAGLNGYARAAASADVGSQTLGWTSTGDIDVELMSPDPADTRVRTRLDSSIRLLRESQAAGGGYRVETSTGANGAGTFGYAAGDSTVRWPNP